MTVPLTAPEPIELSVGVEGMTCASCVNRIERFLRAADGVTEANVNLATERATVRVDPTVAGRAEVQAAIEAAGYDVRPERPRRGGRRADARRGRPGRRPARARDARPRHPRCGLGRWWPSPSWP